jgi:hypothetical protein
MLGDGVQDVTRPVSLDDGWRCGTEDQQQGGDASAGLSVDGQILAGQLFGLEGGATDPLGFDEHVAVGRLDDGVGLDDHPAGLERQLWGQDEHVCVLDLAGCGRHRRLGPVRCP